MVLLHILRDEEFTTNQTLLVRGAEELVGASHVHPLVRPRARHELHLATLLMRRGIDDATVASKRHGVVLALLGVPPPLTGAPKNRLVTLGNVKVSDEHLTRDGMRDHAERTVALLMVGVTPYARTRNNTIQYNTHDGGERPLRRPRPEEERALNSLFGLFSSSGKLCFFKGGKGKKGGKKKKNHEQLCIFRTEKD